MPLKITDIVKKSLPAVVSIVITKQLEKIEAEIPQNNFPFTPSQNEKQRAMLKSLADVDGMVQVGGGSGFIIDSGGIIITNRHVIADKQSEYTIITNDDQKFSAEVLARDPMNDVAILKLHISNQTKGKIKKLPTLNLGNSDKIELGESVLAIGNSLGIFKNTVSAGIISGLSRSIRAQIDPETPTQEIRGLIQTDTAINPGNSGGPLLNAEGEVIGINAAIVFGAQNIGFAIPINTVKRDIQDLKKYGRIKKPLLGIRYLNIDDNISKKMKLPVNNGAVVIHEDHQTLGVIVGTPAYKAGIRAGDIIIKCDGKLINSKITIQDILEKKSADDILELDILRDSHRLNISVKLMERK